MISPIKIELHLPMPKQHANWLKATCCDKLCKSFLAGNADMEDITQLSLLHGCDTVRCTNCRGRAHRACSGQIERGNIQVDLAVGMTTWCLQCIDNTEPFEKESDAFSIAASQSSA